MKDNLAIIGYRGSGKTTIGPRLANRLGWQWIDTDELVVTQSSKTIAQLFKDVGEPAFRKLESHSLVQATSSKGKVISTGGGIVLSPENRSLLKQRCRVVWLDGTLETLWERLKPSIEHDSNRPALTTLSAKEEIASLLAARLPHYQETSDIRVDIEGKTPDDIVSEILLHMEAMNDGLV